MDTKFIDEMVGFMDTKLRPIKVDGLPQFYCGPLTIKQAQEIEKESEGMLKLARHFQVRAKDENGKLVVPGGLEFDRFCAEADLDVISTAIVEMTKDDSGIEGAEKN